MPLCDEGKNLVLRPRPRTSIPGSRRRFLSPPPGKLEKGGFDAFYESRDNSDLNCWIPRKNKRFAPKSNTAMGSLVQGRGGDGSSAFVPGRRSLSPPVIVERCQRKRCISPSFETPFLKQGKRIVLKTRRPTPQRPIFEKRKGRTVDAKTGKNSRSCVSPNFKYWC